MGEATGGPLTKKMNFELSPAWTKKGMASADDAMRKLRMSAQAGKPQETLTNMKDLAASMAYASESFNEGGPLHQAWKKLQGALMKIGVDKTGKLR